MVNFIYNRDMYCKAVLRCIYLVVLFSSINAQEECQRGGCFPATGDLLVGRESKLSASSTCGLNRRERYCIVSFLDQTDKCFYCQSTREVDSRPYGYKSSHLPKYMITTSPRDRLKGWWQSVNGKQDVTLQLNLESEFVFTHLIMTFKTFRPKAMYIERSWNYGRDWSVYRYFAYDCKQSFPDIPRGPQINIDDIICEQRYSRIEPSTEGEVVMKVLDPYIQQNEDPYSLKVQNLLKLTNLRIRFTELHTFGDDVLGDNPEINQKYYYALYEMVVRGSCSCYGHAEQCIPSEGTPANVNMVHGKCNCTHNTAGRNCERCKDGYNDEPWRPAYKDQLNLCKKCNCNDHTDKCHFDPAVYNATGFRSGGVCDDCQHNTAGRQCEQCKPLYFRDPFKNIFDPDVCKPCDCDPSGSYGRGECETVTDPGRQAANGELGTVAGRCICKENVEGKRCDQCKDGYWNLLESNTGGCQSCECDPRGTVEKDTCNQQDGKCRCKRFVKGTRCTKCDAGYWNLGSTRDGCSDCDCDAGGAKNMTCDDISGNCDCRPNIMGRQCNQVRPGYYYTNLDSIKFEGEEATNGRSGAPFYILHKIGEEGKDDTWTGKGFVRVLEGSLITFSGIRVPYSGRYSIVLRYDTQQSGNWNDVKVKITRVDGGRLGGITCGASNEFVGRLDTQLPSDKKAFEVQQSFCFERGVGYNVEIDFRSNEGSANGQTLIDSMVLMPNVDDYSIFHGREGNQRFRLYQQYNCKQYYLEPNRADEAPEVCKNTQFSLSVIMNNGALACLCDQVGTQSTGGSDVLTCKAAGGQCPCKPGVVGRRCDQCAAGYFGFSEQGCTGCDCDRTGSTSEFCHDTTGQCSCLPQLKGRKCNSCPENHYGFPNCRPCQCNGHSSTCDPKTGECTNCNHNTAGTSCEKCANGYYGDASKGTPNDCQRCQCPGGSSGNQFSKTCVETANGAVCNDCIRGYTGNQCEKCDDGYFGNPVIAGGQCIKCDCNNNIDLQASGKCSASTGFCKDCINNAYGDHCEKCQPGYFGNAKNQTCQACICHTLGTEPDFDGVCHAETGQCPCLDNVDGLQCDRCKPGFYNLASGKGCVACNCDPEGSLEQNCNQLDGQCRCRVGYGGRSCSECENFFWGDPKIQDGCKACNCNPVGSTTSQCNRTSGVCQCKDNVIGENCNMCAANTFGIMPKCENCHTCNDQWEDKVSLLEKNVTNLLKFQGNFTYNATEINLYSKEIQGLKNHLKNIEEMMASRSVESKDVDELRKKLDTFRKDLMSLDMKADQYVEVVQNTTVRNKNANDELDKLEIRTGNLKNNSFEFKANVTKIIESNIGGALNSTRDSLRRSREAQKVVDEASEKIKESKKLRKKIKKEIIMGTPSFEELDKQNNDLVDNLTSRVDDLEQKLKELNELLCGGSSGCGGCDATGCTTCGASENCTGIKQLATNALNKAGEAKAALLKKKADAEQILADIKIAEISVNISRDATSTAEKGSFKARTIGEAALKNITSLIKDITNFLNEQFKHPNISKILAMETIQLNISLTPSEVSELARQIREAVGKLTDVDEILKESQKDYNTAIDLKEEALRAKKFALMVMNKTQAVLQTIASAIALQNQTAVDISFARADMKDARSIIEQITKKLDIIDGDLKKAGNDTELIERKKDEVKQLFDDNRKRVAEAEAEVEKAENIAMKVNETSDKLRGEYNKTKEALNDKVNMTEAVRERVRKLGDGAISLFETSNIKLKLLEDLSRKYSKNEEQVQDLLDELRRLEIQSRYVRDKMEKISSCHGLCNPDIREPICVDDLKKNKEQEATELAAHDAAVKNRSNQF